MIHVPFFAERNVGGDLKKNLFLPFRGDRFYHAAETKQAPVFSLRSTTLKAKIDRHELTGVGEIGGRLTDSRSRENRDELV